MQFSVISFPRFRTFCNVILILVHVTDIVSFYVKTMFMFQKNKLKKSKRKKNSFLLKGQDHIHSMQNYLSETLCSQFNYLWWSSKKKFQGK